MLVPILWSIVIVLAGVGFGIGIGLRVGRNLGREEVLMLLHHSVEAMTSLHSPDPEVADEAEAWLLAAGATPERIDTLKARGE